jgi:hypothetical protein
MMSGSQHHEAFRKSRVRYDTGGEYCPHYNDLKLLLDAPWILGNGASDPVTSAPVLSEVLGRS